MTRVPCAALLLACSCYLPNPVPIKHVDDVQQLEIGVSTREDVLRLLGRPQVVESSGLFVYAWQEHAGFFVVAGGYSGIAGSVGLKGTRAIIQFDQEGKVTRIDTLAHKTESKLQAVPCVKIPDLCGRKHVGEFGPLALAFTPDGAALAIIHGVRKADSCVQSVEDGRVLASFDYHPRRCATASFSNDGRRLAAVGARAPLVVWTFPDGSEMRRLGPTDPEQLTYCSTPLALSEDGSLIASQGPDGEFVLWNVEQGELVFGQVLDGGPAHHFAFSPGAALVAAGSGSGLVLLETETGHTVAQRPAAPEEAWLSVPTFSSDGKYLVVASCAHAELWSVRQLRESGWNGSPEAVLLLPFPRSTSTVCRTYLGSSKDGSLLTIVAADVVAVVDVPSGALRVAARLPVSMTPAALNSTSNQLAVVLDRKVRLCQVPTVPASTER